MPFLPAAEKISTKGAEWATWQLINFDIWHNFFSHRPNENIIGGRKIFFLSGVEKCFVFYCWRSIDKNNRKCRKRFQDVTRLWDSQTRLWMFSKLQSFGFEVLCSNFSQFAINFGYFPWLRIKKISKILNNFLVVTENPLQEPILKCFQLITVEIM